MKHEHETQMMGQGGQLMVRPPDMMPPMPGQGQPQGPSPLLKLHLLLRGRYKWAVLLALIFGTVGAIVTWRAIELKYESVGRFVIKPMVDKLIYETEFSEAMPMFEAYVGQQVQVMQSQRVVMDAMESSAWQEKAPGLSNDAISNFIANLEVRNPRRSQVVEIAFQHPAPDVAVVGVRAVMDAYLAIYTNQDATTSVQRMKTLGDLVSAANNEIQAAEAEILNILQAAGEYGLDTLDQRYAQKMAEVNDLKKAITELEVRLASAGVLLQPKSSPEPNENQAAVNPDGDAAAAPAADQQAANKPAPANQANNAKQDQPLPVETAPVAAPMTPQEIAAIDPQMKGLLAIRLELKSRLEKFRAKFGTKHREVEAAEKDLALHDLRIEEYAREFQPPPGGPDSPLNPSAPISPQALSVMEAQLGQLRTRYDDAVKGAELLGTENMKIKKMRLSIEATRQKRDDAKTRRDKLSIESQTSGRVSPLGEPEPPLAPVNAKKRIQATVGGGVVGVALGFGLVLLYGMMRPSLRSFRDIQAGELRMLGVLPSLPHDLTDSAQAAAAAHCVHHIRAMLQLDGRLKETQVLAITGASAGTGKTTLTLSLGLSYAAAGARTLMIDCDMTGRGLTKRVDTIIRRKIGEILRRQGLLDRRQLDEALELAQKTGMRVGEALVELGLLSGEDLTKGLDLQDKTCVGLMDAVAGESLESCVSATGFPGLSILSLGDEAQHHVSRLSPVAFPRVIEAARAQYDVVLLDTGPIPGSVDASIVVVQADGVVLTTTRGDHRPDIERSIRHLNAIGARLSGVVFNRADQDDVEHTAYSVSRTSQAADSLSSAFATADPSGARRYSRFGPLPHAVASVTQSPDEENDESYGS